MLLQDGEYFEPIELKQKGVESVTLHTVESLQSVVALQKSCPLPVMDDVSTDILNKIKNIESWMSLILQNPSQFRMNRIIIRPDMTIYGIMTYCNALILLPRSSPVAILPDLVKHLSVNEVLYQEDIVGKSYVIRNVLTSDIHLLITKLQQLGFGLHLGTSQNSSHMALFESSLHIPSVAPTILPVIKIYSANKMTDTLEKQDKKDRKWNNLQNMIGKTFIMYYDTLVQPLLVKSREKQIDILKNTFPAVPESDTLNIRRVIEEMPYADGKEQLEIWLRSVNSSREQWLYTNPTVFSKDKSWTFSQSAIDNGMEWHKLIPKRAPVASDAFNPSNSLYYNNNTTQRSDTELPCMIRKNKVTEVALPSKFKNYSWAHFKIWKTNTKCGDTAMYDLFAWISEHIKMPNHSADDIAYIKTLFVSKLLQNEDSVKSLADDPSFLLAWSNVTKKKYKKPSELWTKSLESMTPQQRTTIWIENVATSQELKPSDVDLYIMSKLLSLNILIIHRAKHGGTEQLGESYQRGSLTDLSLSSSFLVSGKDWKHHPCIFLYKEYSEKQCDYYIIVDESGNDFVHLTTEKIPKDIFELMELHVANRDDVSTQM